MLSLDVTFERFNLTRKPPLSLVHRSIISDQVLADSLACFIWTSIEFQPYLTFQLRLPTSFRTAMPRFCKYFATRRGRLLLNCRISPVHAVYAGAGRFSPRSIVHGHVRAIKRLLDPRPSSPPPSRPRFLLVWNRFHSLLSNSSRSSATSARLIADL